MSDEEKYKVHRIYFSKNYGTAAQNTRIEQYKLIERGMIFHAVVVFLAATPAMFGPQCAVT